MAKRSMANELADVELQNPLTRSQQYQDAIEAVIGGFIPSKPGLLGSNPISLSDEEEDDEVEAVVVKKRVPARKCSSARARKSKSPVSDDEDEGEEEEEEVVVKKRAPARKRAAPKPSKSKSSDSSDGERASGLPKRTTRKRSAKVDKLKDAFDVDEDENGGVVLDMSAWSGTSKSAGKAFRCKLGENYEVRIDPDFFGRPYVSVRQWSDNGATPGRGLTLRLGYLPKLLAALNAATEHCTTFKMFD